MKKLILLAFVGALAVGGFLLVHSGNDNAAQALNETYIGSCGGSVQDSDGDTVSCDSSERPICYSDGSCTCGDYDNQCD